MPLDEEHEKTLRRTIGALFDASERWYWEAFNLEAGSCLHGYVEFFGLWRELLLIYKDCVEANKDPNELNAHGGYSLPAQPVRLFYIAEKLNCIFGPSIASLGAKDKSRFLKILLEGKDD